MALSVPTFGIRELSLRGAPLDRTAWLGRHDGHDVRLIALPDVRLTLVDEEEDVYETVTDYDKNNRAFQRKTGKTVKHKTGRKLEQTSPAGTNVDLILCVSCGVVGIDHEPAANATKES